MSVYLTETIAAISTAMSESGIGIVRISGDKAIEIADKMYFNKNGKKLKNQKTHTIHYGYIVDGEEEIDEVLVMLMRKPHTFTGEDTVEIDCHGGVYVVKRILDTAIKKGARTAQAGEFTKRAFLNGRIDLSQAEAVIDVINAQNEYALQSSVTQLKGRIKEKIEKIRKEILYHTAFIETALDDPEHISIDGYGDMLKKNVLEIKKEIEKLLLTSENGKIIKEGIHTVILGKPNVGKSSLMNILVGEERAIVTDIAGTTRDVLEENINLQGISLNIMDTAGIRNAKDEVERIGVEKAKNFAKRADLIIYVIDASNLLTEDDYEILNIIQNKKTIILLNKVDIEVIVTKEIIENLYNKKNFKNIKENVKILEISAKKRTGIENLENAIKEMFYKGKLSFNNELYITNTRHAEALKGTKESLERVLDSIEKEMPEDFYSIDLMEAYELLGNITGDTIGEDLVNEIFSKFCMGK